MFEKWAQILQENDFFPIINFKDREARSRNS